MEKVIERLKSQMRSALDDAMRKTFPGMEYDKYKLYRNFESAVKHKCNYWETVPDSAVEKN
jgi:hypothetical protein